MLAQQTSTNTIDSISNNIASGCRAILDALFGSASTKATLSERELSELKNIVQLAYHWDRKTKLSVMLLNFTPLMAKWGDPFDSTRMICHNSEDKVAVEEPPASPILAVATMGLQSTEGLGAGKMECVIHTRVAVLGQSFFDGR